MQGNHVGMLMLYHIEESLFDARVVIIVTIVILAAVRLHV